MSDVSDVEREVAAFIAEYEALCRKHGCMVVMVEPDVDEGDEWQGEGYTAFAVGTFNDGVFLDQSLEEMRLEPPRWIEEAE